MWRRDQKGREGREERGEGRGEDGRAERRARREERKRGKREEGIGDRGEERGERGEGVSFYSHVYYTTESLACTWAYTELTRNTDGCSRNIFEMQVQAL